MPSTLQKNFQCDYLVVQEDDKQMSLIVDLPSIKPMSMNLLTIELKDDTHESKDDEITASDTVVEQVQGSHQGKVLENGEIKVEFDWDNGTYLPKAILFKELGVTFDVDMQFIRYPATVTDSGAYIIAPRSRAIPLQLDVIDAYIMNADQQDGNDMYVQKKLVIFYRSQYLHQCFSLMTISLNQYSNVGQLNFDYKGNVLLNDEVYLRMKVKPRLQTRGAKYTGSQFYVHDSVAHVRRDLHEKRYLMSRDVGSKYYPMVEGASYRF